MKGGGMEKICIVKLRKTMASALCVEEEYGKGSHAGAGRMSTGLSSPVIGNGNRGMREEHAGSDSADGEGEAAEKSIALALTPEQMRVLRSNPRLSPFLGGAFAGGWESTRGRDEKVIIKFEFDSMPPMRLLKVEEAVHILRVSRSYLGKIIRQGGLKSYKFGRLRRILFGDVLSYLEDHRESAGQA
jgi:excisionase family DNA binding protein